MIRPILLLALAAVIAASQALQATPVATQAPPQQWVLSETQIEPKEPQGEDFEGAYKGGFWRFVLTETSASLKVRHVINDEEQHTVDFEFHFDRPPQVLRPGETITLHADGRVAVVFVAGPRTLPGYKLSVYYPNSGGDSILLHGSGGKTSGSETYERKVPLLDSRDRFVMDVTLNGLKCESRCRVRWIYRPQTVPEEAAAAPSGPPAEQPKAEPEKPAPVAKPGDEAIEILTRIGREVIRERIQKDVNDSLQGIGDLLKKGLTSFDRDLKRLSDNPVAYVEGFLTGNLSKEAQGTEGEQEEAPGMSWDEVDDQLSARVKNVRGASIESMEEVFDKVRNIMWEEDPQTGRFQRRRASGQDTAEIKLGSGKSVKVGIMVTPEGRILYTPNGEDYYPDLQTAVDPSLYQQAATLYTDTKKWIWSSLSKGSTRDADRDLQSKVAFEVMDDLRTQLSAGEAPKSVQDWTEGQLWDQVKGPLEQKRNELMWSAAQEALNKLPAGTRVEVGPLFNKLKKEFDAGKSTVPQSWTELKRQSGIDLFDLTKAGKVAVAGGDFAVESIKTMARVGQDTDFAVRTHEYIAQRKEGLSPEVIWHEVREDKIPELTIGAGKIVSQGVSSMMASSKIPQEVHLGVIFTMYEQAYQRYLLAQKMGR